LIFPIKFLWVKKRYKAKVIQAENELKFLKREKEYSREAMMVCSKNHEILFANGAAKTLFSLQKKDDSYVIDGMAELKLATAEPIDFFDAIERKSHTNNGSFHFKDALLVPDAALAADQRGRYLLTVNKDNIVEYRPVKIGSLVDGLRVITQGITAEDRVVVKGIQRARPGSPVTPEEEQKAQPTADTKTAG